MQSRQTGAILSNKNALLSTLGTAYNDLYYSEINSSVSAVECTFGWQTKIALPSLRFNSTSQVNIPIDQFVEQVVLHLRLVSAGNITTNMQLPRGWGYAAIQQVGYTLGASATTTVYLQGDSILQSVFAECNSNEKRSEILALGGEAYSANGANPPPAVFDAYVLIPLPFSSACDKLPIDSTLLGNNISITIAFQPGAAFIASVPGTTLPAQFDVAEIILHQGKLSNQAQSVRQVMIAQPELKYPYPFIYKQAFISAPFAGQTSLSSPCIVQLNAFANADLVGIVFWVVQTAFKAPTGSNCLNPFVPDPISDIIVTFNGSNLFNFPAQSYRLTNMLAGDQMASSYGTPIVPGTIPSASTPAPVNVYPIFLDFARARAACYSEHLFNTFRIPNQVLQVQFITSTTNQYQLYATYFYNASATFQSGTSAINLS